MNNEVDVFVVLFTWEKSDYIKKKKMHGRSVVFVFYYIELNLRHCNFEYNSFYRDVKILKLINLKL